MKRKQLKRKKMKAAQKSYEMKRRAAVREKEPAPVREVKHGISRVVIPPS